MIIKFLKSKTWEREMDTQVKNVIWKKKTAKNNDKMKKRTRKR